jgi:GNAT superfamily N-acetyltransferase
MPLPEGVKVRPLRRGDRDSIYRLLQDVGVNVPVIDQSNTISWIVSHPETEVLIAVDPLDRGVGMISVSHRPSLLLGGRVASVDAIIVTAAMRGKGIASDLLERGLARAKMLGCRAVEVTVSDMGARGYFERRGFNLVGRNVLLWHNPIAR